MLKSLGIIERRTSWICEDLLWKLSLGFTFYQKNENNNLWTIETTKNKPPTKLEVGQKLHLKLEFDIYFLFFYFPRKVERHFDYPIWKEMKKNLFRSLWDFWSRSDFYILLKWNKSSCEYQRENNCLEFAETKCPSTDLFFKEKQRFRG